MKRYPAVARDRRPQDERPMVSCYHGGMFVPGADGAVDGRCPLSLRAHACSGVSVVMAMLVYTVRFVTVVRVVVVWFPQLVSSFFLFAF